MKIYVENETQLKMRIKKIERVRETPESESWNKTHSNIQRSNRVKCFWCITFNIADYFDCIRGNKTFSIHCFSLYNTFMSFSMCFFQFNFFFRLFLSLTRSPLHSVISIKFFGRQNNERNYSDTNHLFELRPIWCFWSLSAHWGLSKRHCCVYVVRRRHDGSTWDSRSSCGWNGIVYLRLKYWINEWMTVMNEK